MIIRKGLNLVFLKKIYEPNLMVGNYIAVKK